MQQNIHGGDIYSRQIRLDFSVNGNPLGMPDAAVQAIHEAVQHVGEYPDITAAALTEAVSRMLSGECGREIPKEYLLFGNGASELFLAVVHAQPPEKVLMPRCQTADTPLGFLCHILRITSGSRLPSGPPQ